MANFSERDSINCDEHGIFTPDEGQRLKLRSSYQRGLAIVGLLLGFALRLYHLGAESLWYDETVSVYLSRQSIPQLIAHTARDIHPPGYYLILHLWQQVTDPVLGFGFEFLFAWPSLWWSLLLPPLIYAVGRRLFTDNIALLALWLAAIHPYHLWYSQEVRMYTVGATLGMLCLWAVVKSQWPVTGRPQTAAAGSTHSAILLTALSRRWTWLAVYVIAAACGLYTLYYFAFLLIALNAFVLLRALRSPGQSRPLRSWLMAQGAVALLWLPWMPVLWRQVTDPPVPPWRGDVAIGDVVRESMAALLIGQSPPLQNEWVWAGVASLFLGIATFSYTKERRFNLSVLLLYVFGPLVLIYLLSVWVTPLYHIRYFFIYAAPVPLLLALAIASLRRPMIGAVGTIALVLISGWSAAEFWTNARYSADDHRSAVTDMAAGWRPGDAILVNAGWIYPILDTYWPGGPHTAEDSVPLPLVDRRRLLDYANKTTGDTIAGPTLITTGSVDGSPSLGWGLPDSDFYAMSRPEAEAALAQLAQSHPRIWHYRLYDTVSDPSGLLRAKLEEVGELRLDRPYPGRDFLRLQLYETAAARQPGFCPQSGAAVEFGDALRLHGTDTPVAATAGRYLYTTLCWEALEAVAAYPAGLRTSLRLYPSRALGETLLAQLDTAPLLATMAWQPGETYRQPLALPLPASIAPGQYTLALVVYDGGDGAPLAIADPAAIYGQIWPLFEITIGLATTER